MEVATGERSLATTTNSSCQSSITDFCVVDFRPPKRKYSPLKKKEKCKVGHP